MSEMLVGCVSAQLQRGTRERSSGKLFVCVSLYLVIFVERIKG